MSVDGGLAEAVRQLTIANEKCPDPWALRVLVQKDIDAGQIPEGLSNSEFFRLRGRYLRSVAGIWRDAARADYVVATDLRLYLIAVVALLFRLRSPRRVTFWINSIPLVIGGASKRMIFRLTAMRSNLIFASEAIKKTHAYRWHRGPHHTVLYGIPDHGFLAQDIGQHNPAVLQYTAAFVGWKNHDMLLRAFAGVIEAGEQAELRLVGDGALRPSIETLAHELGVGAHTTFMGARSDARELLRHCDVYIHPSIGEGLGIAVVEAMFASLPIVASDSGAFPEYLAHGATALLVDCERDDEALASAIREVLRQTREGGAVEMGRAARKAALETFGTSRYINEWRHAVAAPSLIAD